MRGERKERDSPNEGRVSRKQEHSGGLMPMEPSIRNEKGLGVVFFTLVPFFLHFLSSKSEWIGGGQRGRGIKKRSILNAETSARGRHRERERGGERDRERRDKDTG